MAKTRRGIRAGRRGGARRSPRAPTGEQADRHACTMPCGYYAPQAFAKFLHEGVVFGSSRRSTIDFFLELQHRTVITCVRCGARWRANIWTREQVDVLYALAKNARCREPLERAMTRKYARTVVSCRRCGRAAHLAFAGQYRSADGVF